MPLHNAVFFWNEWKTKHIGKHRVAVAEAEFVVQNCEEPFPWEQGDDKFLVWGSTQAGKLLQVIFVPGPDDTVCVIHARPLTAKESERWNG